MNSRSINSSPTAQIGIIRRVIITDGGDYTNFEWKFGEGVTYPPRNTEESNATHDDAR